MTFAHAHLLWFLLFIPAFAGLKMWVDSMGSRAESVFTATRLRSALVTGRSRWRSWLIYSFYALALACIIVATAQPRWGEEKLEIPDKGRNVFIAIDTSRSMLARDVEPDRLTRARLAAHDLVNELAGERVGLLAFAGRAYLQAPLTTDHEAIFESLQVFDHTIIEWGGSNMGDLLDVTLRAVKTLPKANYALVIFSDGGDADANLTSYIARLKDAGVVVVTVGVGSEIGTLIPNPEMDGDYIRDEANNVVRSRLETGVLQQLATATGGRFLKLGTQPLNRRAIQPVLDRLTEQQSANRETSRPIERFAWPLGLGIFLLMFAWIFSALSRPPVRSLALALAVAALLAPDAARAAGPVEMLASIFQSKGPTPDDAQKALESGDFKKARELYGRLLERRGFDDHARDEMRYGLATAEHDLTNYDGSARIFSEVLHTQDQSLRARAHRGLGHTLFDQGARGLQEQPKITIQRWTDSLRHLDAALELTPDNADLRANRDHVAKMLDELRKVMEKMEQQQQGQKGQKGEKGQKGQKGEGQGGEEGDQEGAGKEGSDPNGGDKKKESENKGEKKDEDDGIGGKDAKELPEGRLQAAGGDKGDEKEGQKGNQGQQPGEGEGDKKQAQATPGDQRNPRTGYTPGEAESLLRQYMDEITGPLTNRYHSPPENKKDW